SKCAILMAGWSQFDISLVNRFFDRYSRFPAEPRAVSHKHVLKFLMLGPSSRRVRTRRPDRGEERLPAFMSAGERNAGLASAHVVAAYAPSRMPRRIAHSPPAAQIAFSIDRHSRQYALK